MRTQPARALAGRRGRLSAYGWSALLCIVAIVAMVSLPRLREWGMRENAMDAARLAKLLAQSAAARRATHPGEPPPSLRELVAADASLQRALVDSEWMPRGELRCHGYLFALAQGPGSSWLLAWPWTYAKTGRESLACAPDGALRRNANERGSYSGLERAPALAADGALPGDEWLPAR